MRRPVGVILTCIALGFAALILLLSAMGSVLSIFLVGHMPPPGAQYGQTTPMPGMMNAIFVVLGLFYTTLATWAIITIVGLARMRNWARYSVIVIGAGLALVGVFGALGTVAMRAMMNTMPMPPNQNPQVLHIVMIFGALFWLAVIGIGIWWIIYFALRSTREAFALAVSPRVAVAHGYVPPPSPYDASSYEVASYIPIADPNTPPVPSPVLMLDQAVAAPAPPRLPLTITIIAWLLIASGVITLPFSLLNFPTFILGTAVSGWSAHLVLLSLGVIGLLSGIGLLRLEKAGLYASYAYCLFGIVNSAFILVPSVRDRMFAYQTEIMQKFSFGMPQPFPIDQHTMILMTAPGVVFAVVYCLVLIVLLFLNRDAFDHTAQAAAA